MLGIKGKLAFDLIDFKTESQIFKDFIVYFLRNTVVCETFEKAL